MSAHGGRRLAAIATLAAFAVIWTVPAAAGGSSDLPTRSRIVELKAGFGGKFRVGYWTPTGVTVEAGREDLYGRVELIAPDGDAVLSRVRAREPVKIVAGQRGSQLVYVKIGQLKSELTASFRSESGGIVAT